MHATASHSSAPFLGAQSTQEERTMSSFQPGDGGIVKTGCSTLSCGWRVNLPGLLSVSPALTEDPLSCAVTQVLVNTSIRHHSCWAPVDLQVKSMESPPGRLWWLRLQKPLLEPHFLPSLLGAAECPVGSPWERGHLLYAQWAQACSSHNPALAGAALWPVGGATQPLPQAAKVGSLVATLHNSAPLLLSLFLPDTQLLLFIWLPFLCYGIWVVFPSLPTPAADS